MSVESHTPWQSYILVLTYLFTSVITFSFTVIVCSLCFIFSTIIIPINTHLTITTHVTENKEAHHPSQ
jgi:hypothetical protein